MAEPTLDAIRARVANATGVLWQLHGPRDLAWLLERYDAAVHQCLEQQRVFKHHAASWKVERDERILALEARVATPQFILTAAQDLLDEAACASPLANLHMDVSGVPVGSLSDAYAKLVAAREERYDAAVASAPALTPPLDLSSLTPRERAVVDGLASGARLSAIAAMQGLSKHTVRSHVKSVFRKLGVGSQVELLAKLGGRRG